MKGSFRKLRVSKNNIKK